MSSVTMTARSSDFERTTVARPASPRSTKTSSASGACRTRSAAVRVGWSDDHGWTHGRADADEEATAAATRKGSHRARPRDRGERGRHLGREGSYLRDAGEDGAAEGGRRR